MPSKTNFVIVTPTRSNEIWEIATATLDIAGRPTVVLFMHDHTRLPLYGTETTVRAGGVSGPLDELGAKFGYPKTVRVDASSELSSAALQKWASKHQVSIEHRSGIGTRVNPTGSWAKNAPAKKPVWEAVAGNDPL